jgi:hypothetical protein
MRRFRNRSSKNQHHTLKDQLGDLQLDQSAILITLLELVQKFQWL